MYSSPLNALNGRRNSPVRVHKQSATPESSVSLSFWRKSQSSDGNVRFSWVLSGDRPKGLKRSVSKPMGAIRITSWYPKFNGSHFYFCLPPSSIHRTIRLGGEMMWTAHRPHWFISFDCFSSNLPQWSFRFLDSFLFFFSWQVTNRYRSSVTIPHSGWAALRDVLTDYCDQMPYTEPEADGDGRRESGSEED